MRKVRIMLLGMMAVMAMGFITANAQDAMMKDHKKMMMQSGNTMMMKTAMRLETQTDWFKDSLGMAFDSNRVDDTAVENEVMSLVRGFEIATDRYSERVHANEVIPTDVERLLSRALLIEAAMSKVPASPNAKQDWMMIRYTLENIAKANNVAWVWTVTANPFWKTAAVEPIYDRLDTRSDEFLNSFRYGIDTSKVNGTELEDEAIELVSSFEDTMDMLEAKVDDAGMITSVDMDKVMRQGMLIEAFMETHDISSRARRDWMQVKASMRELAMRSNVAWTWTVKPVATK